VPRKTKKSQTIVDSGIHEILKGENLLDIFNSLQQGEKDLFEQVVNEIRNGGSTTELQNLWKLDYIKPPPTINQFIFDDYYLGQVIKPQDDNPGMWPTWIERLVDDFDLDSRISNLVITGSLGGGKTFVTCVIMMYRITLAAMLRNPQNFYGLSKGSRLVYAILSVTRAVVAETAFGDMLNFMSNSPFFMEQLNFNPNSKYVNQSVNLGKGLMLTAGSQGQHVIGRNAIGIAIDEGNFRREANPDMQAYKLYEKVRTRIKNRFQKMAGFLPAISIISSSATGESSFTEKVIGDITKLNDERIEKVYRVCFYEMKDSKRWWKAIDKLKLDKEVYASIVPKQTQKLKERRFKVSYGIKNVDPRMLDGWYDDKGNKISGVAHEDTPNGAKVELVPEDFIEEFKRNTKVALQDLSGISVGGSMRLFANLTDVFKCMQDSIRFGVLDSRKPGVKRLPISSEDDQQVWDYLEHKNFLTRVAGTVVPLRHPNALRFAHLDLATRTVAGLSICHRVGTKNVKLFDPLKGTHVEEDRVLVEYDMILPITAGFTKPINFEKIMKFFIWLKERAGFNFGLITADQFQSHTTLQMLEERGFKTGYLSLDREKKPYYGWRTAFEEGRILIPQYEENELLITEMENLLDLPKKIDHPEQVQGGAEGSKDITDSAAGAFWNAVMGETENAAIENQLPIQSNELPGGMTGTAEYLNNPVTMTVDTTRREVRRYDA
jgi:hypothetical protein